VVHPAPFFPVQLVTYFYPVKGKQEHANSQNPGIDDVTFQVLVRICKMGDEERLMTLPILPSLVY